MSLISAFDFRALRCMLLCFLTITYFIVSQPFCFRWLGSALEEPSTRVTSAGRHRIRCFWPFVDSSPESPWRKGVWRSSLRSTLHELWERTWNSQFEFHFRFLCHKILTYGIRARPSVRNRSPWVHTIPAGRTPTWNRDQPRSHVRCWSIRWSTALLWCGRRRAFLQWKVGLHYCIIIKKALLKIKCRFHLPSQPSRKPPSEFHKQKLGRPSK